MAVVSTRIRIGVVATLAFPQVLIGLWAVVRPAHWYEHFPGPGPRLVAAHPPFNEHLATDAGAGFLAIGVALAVAAASGHRIGIRIALLTYAVHALPHLAYHAARPAPRLTAGEDLLNLTLLASGPLLAALFAWRAGAPAGPDGNRHRRPAADEDPSAPALEAPCPTASS